MQDLAKSARYSFVDGPFGSDLKNEEYTESGIPLIQLNNINEGAHVLNSIKYVSPEKADQLGRHNAFPGDIAIAKMADPVARAAIVNDSFDRYVIVADCIRLSVEEKFAAPSFAVYAINSPYFRSHAIGLSSGITRLRINLGALKQIRLALPPLCEQTQIAAFLDRETAKIDALVAEQRRLMALLKEKRQAVISHAVTRGLNPDAPMKPSGIEWLGDVPEHWDVQAMKRLFRLIVEPAPADNDHELLSLYTEIGVRPRKSLEAKGNKATTTDGYWMVKKGDIIVNKLLAWMGAIGISDYEGVTSPAYDILRQKVPLEPRYYDFLLRCGICFTEFRRYSRGIMDMRLRLYFDELGQLLMPYPPLAEQHEIVTLLQQELTRFDALTSEAQRAIDLLQERRTALISAAVTGQIDVRSTVMA